MGQIFFTSDTHFGHDKDFVYAARGFESIEAMNDAIVENWNKVVMPEDTVYHLGDVFMLEPENIEYVRRLSGKIRLIRGNHDTDAKVAELLALPNIESVSYAEMLDYKKFHFFLSHYPTLSCSAEIKKENVDKGLRNRTMCLHGHTHQTSPYFNGQVPYIYNVGMDAHGCTPISVEKVINDIRKQHEILQKLTGGRRFVAKQGEE